MAAMSPAAPTEGIKGRLACALCESGRPNKLKLFDPKPGSIKRNGCDRRDRRRLEKFRDIPATAGRAELGGEDEAVSGSGCLRTRPGSTNEAYAGRRGILCKNTGGLCNGSTIDFDSIRGSSSLPPPAKEAGTGCKLLECGFDIPPHSLPLITMWNVGKGMS